MNLTESANSLSASGLQVIDLGKRYAESKYVLSGLHHTFKPGSATALIGPNGAGKTTFIRLVSAAAFPTTGKVLFNGISVHEDIHGYLSKTGIVGDTSDLPQFLTAAELVESVMRSRKLWTDARASESARRRDELFEAVELDDRRDSLIGTYSSGMQQKTMIAAALAGNPEILLLDEPFRALDVSAVRSVMVVLKQYRDQGGIILISSHQGEILEELCDAELHFPHVL
jgi:ABC-type multidrug transport system ATPase subunit